MLRAHQRLRFPRPVVGREEPEMVAKSLVVMWVVQRLLAVVLAQVAMTLVVVLIGMVVLRDPALVNFL